MLLYNLLSRSSLISFHIGENEEEELQATEMLWALTLLFTY